VSALAHPVELPHTDVFRFYDPPGIKGHEMQFRLVYQGMLPSAKWEEDTRRKEKHAIRKVLREQLAGLWQAEPLLAYWQEKSIHEYRENEEIHYSLADGMIANHAKYGFNWLPLVSEQHGLACSLDILFLRRDPPGKIIKSGGDLDNRIKVLFDALRMPDEAKEVAGFTPDVNEDPFYVLLQNDSLINEIKITSDRLLIPLKSGEGINDVVLVIHVKTTVANPRAAPIDFYR
jgi:hypothetical protein